MSEINCSRRDFISLASLALAAPAVSAVPAIAAEPNLLSGAPARNVVPSVGAGDVPAAVQCLVYDAKGQPLPPSALEVHGLDRFHLCDLLMRPFTTPDVDEAVGSVRFTPPTDRPFRIAMPLEVPGFGTVFSYADDGGRGWTARSLAQASPLVLNYAFAQDRMATVRRVAADCKQLGVDISPETQRRIDSAQAALDRAEKAGADHTTQVQESMESFRDSLYAGEMLVMARAQHAIATQLARPGFLFGCNGFGLASGSPEVRHLFQAAFNYTTIPIYEGWVEKEKGHPDYSFFEGALDTLINTAILPKGHPAIWLEPENTPKWLQNISYEETKKYCLQHVQQAISRYRHRVHIWDAINEAEVQPETKRGMAGFTREQNVDLTVSALVTAHAADPTCFRCVNITGTWADYYMSRNPAPWQQSPYDYLTMMRDADAKYEVIGLQYYHSGRDFLEWERDLESFNHFGKAIHITEIGFPSSLVPTPDEGQYALWGGGEGGEGLAWHNDFTETTQADYLEYLYTLAYSKPWVEAITWWDFNGRGHDGFLREDGLTPKEIYHRLLDLRAKWLNTGTVTPEDNGTGLPGTT